MIERHFLPQDQESLTELWLAHRLATGVYLYPTIWRYRLLLSSRVWDRQRDTRIWQAENGKTLAFGMLWRRQPSSPYLGLDLCIDPTADMDQRFLAGLQWGLQRARNISQEDKIGITLFAYSFNNFNAPDIFEAQGFNPVPLNEKEHNLYFIRSLRTAIETPPLPEGYSIRQLQPHADLDAYNEVYGFTAVTPQHLAELLTSDEYHQRLLVSTSGEFAAYCEVSFFRKEWQQSGIRLGWIDYIGTRPEDRRRGFGRAILLNSLRYLQSQGAETATLVTVSSNTPAIALYQNAGFETSEVTQPISYQIDLLPE